MKKILFLIKILIFINLSNLSIANTTIVYVDMDKILSSSKPGSFLINQLNELDKKNIDNFSKIEKNLKDKETKLISQKKILADVDFQNKINELRKEVQLYNQNRQKAIKEANKKKIENTNNLLRQINPILTKFSDENKISLILKKKDIIIGKSSLDITDQIIELVNKDIKETKIK
tara:strand:- start:38 stop:562 length:525 start_codon:yes stop_codon:yes gene_type:complete